jgi:hypothetical protein
LVEGGSVHFIGNIGAHYQQCLSGHFTPLLRSQRSGLSCMASLPGFGAIASIFSQRSSVDQSVCETPTARAIRDVTRNP